MSGPIFLWCGACVAAVIGNRKARRAMAAR